VLAVVQRQRRDRLPELRFANDAGEDGFGTIEGAIKTADKPEQSRRDVEIAPLRGFQHVVVVLTLGPNLPTLQKSKIHRVLCGE